MRPLLSVFLIVSSAQVAAQQQSDYGFEYFNVVGRVQAEAKAVGWMSEICGSSFPAVAHATKTAYTEWAARNRLTLDLLDAQYAVIVGYWKGLSERDRRGAKTEDQMRSELESQRPALERQLKYGDANQFQTICLNYSRVLQSPKYELEARWARELRIIRAGPR